ncbi:MAG TPA: TonB family protein [Thermoanaerobaculia bacterium]
MPKRFLTAAALLLLLGNGALELRAQEAPPATGEPYRVGGGVTRPEKISGAPPAYTEEARKARVTGVVILESIIDEQGNVTNVKVLKGLPMGLSEAAAEAVQNWKFKPATFEGRPVKVYYTLTVNFQVDSAPSFGPMFRKFLDSHPDFAQHLGAKRYQEAAALLDRWVAERPADSELSLARSYLLLQQGRLDEALEEAGRYRGPDPHEILFAIGSSAWTEATQNRVLTPEARAAVIELGLQALSGAMEARSDDFAAVGYTSLLLREKAKLTSDPDARQELIDEAGRLQKLAYELQAKAREAKEKQQE